MRAIPVRRMAVACAMAVVVAVALGACAGDLLGSMIPGDTPSTAPAASVDEFDPVVIDSTPSPDWITVTPDGAWVANVGPGLTRYDRTGAVTAEVETGEITQAMEIGFGRLWLASTEAPDGGAATLIGVALANPADVLRIPLTDVRIPPESSVAVTADAVWVLATPVEAPDEPVIVRVDPGTALVTGTIPAPTGAGPVRGGFGSLWVSRPAKGTVQRIDPATGALQAAIGTGSTPTFLAVGAGAVWVMNSATGTVTRIEPDNDTCESVAVTDGPIDGGDITVGDTAVWVRTSSELAVRLDTATLDVTQRVGTPAGSGSLGIDGTGLWISAHDVERVWYIPDVG